MSGDRSAARLYRTLLRLYPRRFRDEYGADMAQLLREQRRDEPAWRVWGRLLADLTISVPTQHLEAHMHRPPNRVVPLLWGVVAATGLLVARGGVGHPAFVIVGLVAAVAAATASVIAWRRVGPIRDRPPSAEWWKLILAGPLLIGVVIVASGLGVQAWNLGMLTVMMAFALTATGLVLGAVRLSGRRSRSMPA